MHFMYIHNHSVEKCLIDQPQETQKMLVKMREEAQKANVKITGFVAAHEHTIYAIIEADDLVALEKVLAPLTKWGDSSLIPVVPIQQAT
jgi:hypothetical protein